MSAVASARFWSKMLRICVWVFLLYSALSAACCTGAGSDSHQLSRLEHGIVRVPALDLDQRVRKLRYSPIWTTTFASSIHKRDAAHIGLIGPQRGKCRANSAVKHFYDMISGSTGRSWHPHLGTASTRTHADHPTTHSAVPSSKVAQEATETGRQQPRAP